MHIAIRQLEGRNHYVVPTVMITVGVHSGSAGPVYYPADELRASVPFWNAKPVVVYHPSMNGSPWAGNADVFNRQKIGVLFNTRFDGRRLLTEAWLDVVRVGEVDARVERAIRTKAVMEVSTGLVFEMGVEPGALNGRSYHTTARRLAPDHLAILPDIRGACSVGDGAGLCRNDNDRAQCHSVAAGAFAGAYGYADARYAAAAVSNDETPLPRPSLWS